MRPAVIGIAAVLLSGCQFRPTPVPMSGDPASLAALAALAGTWRGTYRGTQSSRTGSITFTVRANGDSAFGDVLMEASTGMTVVHPADDPIAHRQHASQPRLLAVRFVEIVGGEVEGVLEPYVAPDCDCTVTTTFTGRVIADTVRGTFITRGRLIAPQTGVWAATRQRPVASR